MPEKSIQSTLRETFSLHNKDVWKQFASQELEGKNPEEVLSWNTEDDISFSSYYDVTDLNQNNLADKFRLTVGDDPYFGPAKWLNIPVISVTSEKIANQTALQHLTSGADGILFESSEKLNLENLLDSIDWRFCSVFFRHAKSGSIQEQLQEYVLKKYPSINTFSGGLFWDVIPNFDKRVELLAGLKNYLTINSSTAVKEIAAALTAGVQFFEQSGNKSQAFFNTVAFSVPINNSFLESIAKLKAIRYLWFQVARAYGFESFEPSTLQLHARSEKWIEEKFQPHGNMLHSTVACMAAVIGGADAITIYPEDVTNTMMNRMARNVSNLVREESHLDKVSDPAAGAYAIDAITTEFSKQAWRIFQESQIK